MAKVTEKGIVVFKSEIRQGVSKAGNPWANMDVVIESNAGYNAVKRVALRCNSSQIDEVNALALGTLVEYSYGVSAREYNGKWYNEVSLIDIRLLDGKQKSAPSPAPADNDDDLPEFLRA